MSDTTEAIARRLVAESGLPISGRVPEPSGDYAFFARFAENDEHGILLAVQHSGCSEAVWPTGSPESAKSRELYESVIALAESISDAVDNELLSRTPSLF